VSTVERAGALAPPFRRRLLRRRDGRAPLWIELAVAGWLFWLYDVVNDFAPERRAFARNNALSLLSFERSLGIDIERSLNHWLSLHSVLAFVATYYYFFAHALVTAGVLAWLWWRAPVRYRRMRTQLVLINLIAFVVFWRYPLAPPRMFPKLGYSDVVAASHAVISWHSAALSHDADQFAAMPSLHIAWASWSALAIWRMASRPALRALGPVHVALTAFVVLATGIICLNAISQFEGLQVATNPFYVAAFGTAGSNALVLLLLDTQHYGTLVAQIFFGLWLVPLGYLAYRSALFPKWLGVVLVAGGVCYLVDLLAAFLVPAFGHEIHAVVVIPSAIAEISMVLYLLVVGVRTAKADTPTLAGA